LEAFDREGDDPFKRKTTDDEGECKDEDFNLDVEECLVKKIHGLTLLLETLG